MKTSKKLSADQVDIAINELMGWRNLKREDYWLGDVGFSGICGDRPGYRRGRCPGYCEGDAAAVHLREALQKLMPTDEDAEAFDRALRRLLKTRRRVPFWKVTNPECAIAILMVKKPELFE